MLIESCIFQQKNGFTDYGMVSWGLTSLPLLGYLHHELAIEPKLDKSSLKPPNALHVAFS